MSHIENREQYFRLSVCLAFCPVSAFCLNEWTYHHIFAVVGTITKKF